jgi:endonuclease III
MDDLMGGGAQYDRPWMVLLTTVLLNQMHETDQKVFAILQALENADLITPETIADTTAETLKALTKPHDPNLPTAWLVEMCKALVEKNDGLIPVSIEGLLDLKVKAINGNIATAVCQDAFGWLYGPSVDTFYVPQMVVALDLIDVSEHGNNKKLIDAANIDPNIVRASLLTWLPASEWNGFNTLMVSTAQLLMEPTKEHQLKDIKKIMKSRFVEDDSNLLLGMAKSIEEVFSYGT